jgi:hypothetical protein
MRSGCDAPIRIPIQSNCHFIRSTKIESNTIEGEESRRFKQSRVNLVFQLQNNLEFKEGLCFFF